MDIPGVQELHSEMELEWDWDSPTCPNTCVLEHVPFHNVMSISAQWVIHSTGFLEFRPKGGHTVTHWAAVHLFTGSTLGSLPFWVPHAACWPSVHEETDSQVVWTQRAFCLEFCMS